MHAAAIAMFQPTTDDLRRRTDPRIEIVARDDRPLSVRPLPDDPWSSQVHWVRWTEVEAETRITEVLHYFRMRPPLQPGQWRNGRRSGSEDSIEREFVDQPGQPFGDGGFV